MAVPDDRVGIALAISRDDDGYLIVLHFHSRDGTLHEVHGTARFVDQAIAKEHGVRLMMAMEQSLGGVFSSSEPSSGANN